MTNIHVSSGKTCANYSENSALAFRLAHVFGRSAAMGLLSADEITELDAISVRGLVADLQQHGLAGNAGVHLAPLMQDKPQPWDDQTTQLLERRLDDLAQVLEDSPNPDTEWRSMREVFGDDLLGSLVEISPSSLRRYATAERATPDEVAAKLHWLAMVVSDLAGGYNALGMRRWFERPRAQLDKQSPRQALGSQWQPHSPAALAVRKLAAALSGAQPLAV